ESWGVGSCDRPDIEPCRIWLRAQRCCRRLQPLAISACAQADPEQLGRNRYQPASGEGRQGRSVQVGGSMRKTGDSPQSYQHHSEVPYLDEHERISLARVWLQGYASERNGYFLRRYAEGDD